MRINDCCALTDVVQSVRKSVPYVDEGCIFNKGVYLMIEVVFLITSVCLIGVVYLIKVMLLIEVMFLTKIVFLTEGVCLN